MPARPRAHNRDTITVDHAGISRTTAAPPGRRLRGARPSWSAVTDAAHQRGTVGVDLNGDLVLEFAGKQLRTGDDLAAAYAELRKASTWTIEGERQGAPFVVTLVVTD